MQRPRQDADRKRRLSVPEETEAEIGVRRRKAGIEGERPSQEALRPDEHALLDEHAGRIRRRRGIARCDGKEPKIGGECGLPAHMSQETLEKERVDLGGESDETLLQSLKGGGEPPALDVADDIYQFNAQRNPVIRVPAL